MTKVNRTSAKSRKPGVYVDQTNLQKNSNTAFLKQMRAREFAALRAKGTANAQPAATAIVAAAPKLAAKRPAPVNDDANENAEEEAAEEEEEEEDEEEEEKAPSLEDDDDDAAASTLDGASTAPVVGIDGFTVAFTPYHTTAQDSSTVTATTISSLKDDRVLGVALWEWLLTKLDWDVHTMWEKFLVDWDLITETERPPGTNRPVNLHAYTTYLRNANNKRVVRQDIREVRATLEREREAAVANSTPEEDPYARPNLLALNGTLLSYYLKIKRLIPYESASQAKKRLAAERRQKAAEAAGALPDEIVEHESKQPKAKKQKTALPTTTAEKVKAAQRAATTAPPPSSSLVLGKASCFAALLDCD